MSARRGRRTETHHLTLYKTPSGALVFGAGTVQWSWGLDNTNAWENFIDGPERQPARSEHASRRRSTSSRDMGVQPDELDLRARGRDRLDGHDRRRRRRSPRPPPAQPRQDGNSGHDLRHRDRQRRRRGRRRRGVDRRRLPPGIPATLTTPTARRSTGPTRGSPTRQPDARRSCRARSTTAATSRRRPPASPSTSTARAPCSATSTPPTAGSTGDPSSVEVGMKFQSSVVRHRSPASASTRRRPTPARTSAACGPPAAQLLAQARSPTRPRRAGRARTFSSPVTIMPNTTYVVGYFAPNGHYSGDSATGSIRRRRRRRPAAATTTARRCHAVPNNTSANGLFAYSASIGVPDEHVPGQQLLGRRQLHGRCPPRAR